MTHICAQVCAGPFLTPVQSPRSRSSIYTYIHHTWCPRQPTASMRMHLAGWFYQKNEHGKFQDPEAAPTTTCQWGCARTASTPTTCLWPTSTSEIQSSSDGIPNDFNGLWEVSNLNCGCNMLIILIHFQKVFVNPVCYHVLLDFSLLITLANASWFYDVLGSMSMITL